MVRPKSTINKITLQRKYSLNAKEDSKRGPGKQKNMKHRKQKVKQQIKIQLHV